MKKSRLRLWVLSAIAVFVFVCWVVPREPAAARVEREATALIQQIESLKTKDGAYPKMLPPETVQRLGKIWPRWAYGSPPVKMENGTPQAAPAFVLTLGNYNLDGFVLTWNSHDHEWTRDM